VVNCVIAGGGPAGMLLSLLLARAGLSVTVLEKHEDFFRDFRGDTVHPSTLTLLDELGLGAEFAALRPRLLQQMRFRVGSELVTVGDFRRLPGRHPHVAMIPQWDFLDLLARAGAREPGHRLLMGAEVLDLVIEDDTVRGVRYRRHDVTHTLRADLVVGADGRTSTVRSIAALPLREFGVPIDVWWFRVPRFPEDPAGGMGQFTRGAGLVLIDRGDYYQAGLVSRKGLDDRLRAEGVEAFRRLVAACAPWLGDRLSSLTSLDEVKLLSVRLSRLRRWWRPGLLCIGDAAHAMSPVGGVGINLAIQDAVAAARVLAGPLAGGPVPSRVLARVQRRRSWPTAAVQFGQRLAHHVLSAATQQPLPSAGAATDRPQRLPLIMRLWRRAPILATIPGFLVGIGLRPEHAPSWARRPAEVEQR
jgi:2-polyprenyl-6-methoxyphenol hydroxylase-like FAD-dependent oxidoreductase